MLCSHILLIWVTLKPQALILVLKLWRLIAWRMQEILKVLLVLLHKPGAYVKEIQLIAQPVYAYLHVDL